MNEDKRIKTNEEFNPSRWILIDEAEAIEYALKRFDERVSKSNIKILGHDIDFPD